MAVFGKKSLFAQLQFNETVAETVYDNIKELYNDSDQRGVVSDKMDKTITVVVETKRNHPVYGKRINYSKKYKAHDENNVAKEGDIVRIMETRPLSATKRFRLVEVVEEAVII